MSGYAVSTRGLEVRYGRTTALSSVDLDLGPGRIHGLLGRNGTGKTTLMSTIASLRRPHHGSLLVEGADPFENEALMERVCLIRESGQAIIEAAPAATLNVLQRARPTFDREYAESLMTLFGIDASKKPGRMSRGQQSAFGAVIGLSSRAPLTMFDEVHLGMDAPTRQLFYDSLIADFAEHPRTIIISSHLISEIETFLDTVTILSGGTVMLSEEADDVRSKGVTLTGPAALVDAAAAGHHPVGLRDLGPTRAVTLFEDLDPAVLHDAERAGVRVGPVPLQDLFIHLTKKSI